MLRLPPGAIAVAFLAAPLAAQGMAPPRTIEVTGTGIVQTPPDIATLDFWVRGEGTTSDAAMQALATKQKAITGALTAFLGRNTSITTGTVMVIEVRDRSCEDNRGYNSQPRLSQGACAVIGYLASMQGAIRTPEVAKAGTAAGLAARLGASDARLQGFQLADPEAAMRRASAAAIADARRRAEVAASGAGVTLGALMTVRDQNGFMASPIAVTGARMSAPPPPAPPPPPPVEIDVKPRPIETRTQIGVVFAIAP